MKARFFIAAIIMLLSCAANAQKKVDPVSQSALTGVVLPKDSRQDKRFLSEISAKVLLEMESNKVNTKIKSTEVLYLPAVATSGFNADSLVNQLTAIGWNITAVESDNKYVWLQKDGRTVLTYFSMDLKKRNYTLEKRKLLPIYQEAQTTILYHSNQIFLLSKTSNQPHRNSRNNKIFPRFNIQLIRTTII